METNGGQKPLDSHVQGSYSQSCLRKRKGKKERKRGVAKEGKARKAGDGGMGEAKTG